jgi:hypothetical protein
VRFFPAFRKPCFLPARKHIVRRQVILQGNDCRTSLYDDGRIQPAAGPGYRSNLFCPPEAGKKGFPLYPLRGCFPLGQTPFLG